MKPNGNEYNPDPDYLRELIVSTRLTRKELGKILGCDKRTIQRWLSGDRQFNYRDQFALEVLVLVPES